MTDTNINPQLGDNIEHVANPSIEFQSVSNIFPPVRYVTKIDINTEAVP